MPKFATALCKRIHFSLPPKLGGRVRESGMLRVGTACGVTMEIYLLLKKFVLFPIKDVVSLYLTSNDAVKGKD
jgi:hypothetical protein